ncbi:KPN_02809 family neutral zinc metallopeptidase [Neisseria sp. Ec49-e6-T10]|uniref:KPN_02809 family neutral zinc metallopeptidase n=1 Tax=Neisseria sp. Ec49-e6-T10 TaxID=3140744 RepID=UPI003EB9C050
MRWKDRRQSNNIEDRRGSSGGGFLFGGGKVKIIMFIVVLVAGYYGVDLSPLLNTSQTLSEPTQTQPVVADAQEQEWAQLTSVVLASTEDTWQQQFAQLGKQYKEPKLVLYRNVTRTGCGAGQAVMGPFYCPADETIYIDLSFYDDMKNKLGGGGDFAQGYVVAHEVGHHVQHLLGIDTKVRAQQQRLSEAGANKLSVKMELQADCLAGIWGHEMQKQNILEIGDLEAALNTAQAIGDDRLQQQSSGRVVPDSFTHGTSAQRYEWFKRGFDKGNINSCDTFS